ncbi:MAG: (d)CMP kinase [Chloroflexia bacterium]|nr:(d)CMP kinase [Chloroflexia bacterium]
MSFGPDDHRNVIAIDGPAAAGKSTVARLLAARLGALLFDTGSLYRALTVAARRDGVAAGDGPALARLARTIEIEVRPDSAADGRLYSVLLDGEDVTWVLRSLQVEQSVSMVAAHPQVRDALMPHQRRIAAGGSVVMVGRDIGTVVVPDAGLKVFLLASEQERARRRFDEQRARGGKMTLDEVLTDLRRRDALDASRATAPLRAADDALLVATDGLDIDQVVAEIVHLARLADAERDSVVPPPR